MLLRETIRTAWRSLLANRLRTALTALGVVIGVAAVVAVLAMGEGAQASVESNIRALGANLLTVRPGAASFGHIRSAAVVDTLTVADAEAIATLPGVSAVAPVITGAAQARFFESNMSATVLGVTEDYLQVRSLEVSHGLGVSRGDEHRRARVAVIGATTKKDLFGDADALGERIQLRGVAFRVIGILKEQGTSGFDSTDEQILVPLSTHRSTLFGKDYVNSIFLQAEVEDDIPRLEERIEDLLRLRHRLHAEEEDDFNVRTQTEILERMSAITGTLTALLAAIAAVSLLVGGIGIMNIMLVSVRERTREIGVRMAVGARRNDILLQFLVEAIVVSLFGGLLGVLFGYGIATAIARFGAWETIVPPYAIALALGVSGFVGILFGVGPARHAAHLDPVEALRHE